MDPATHDSPGIRIEDTRDELDLEARFRLLETFTLKGDRPQLIHLHTEEFSAVCPGTGLPDLGTLDVEYIPAERCLELKAYKYYLVSFRDAGIFQEPVADVLFGHLHRALEPRYLKLVLTYRTRGGIDTTVTLEDGDRTQLNPAARHHV